MRITRMRALAALAAAGALAAGGALAVQKSATAAAAEIEDVINACRHPNGG
jgi:nitrous oxide reductase